jgi:hypothetical protein
MVALPSLETEDMLLKLFWKIKNKGNSKMAARGRKQKATLL